MEGGKTNTQVDAVVKDRNDKGYTKALELGEEGKK